MKDVALVLGLNSVHSDILGLDLESEDVVLTDEVETLFDLTRVAIQEYCTNYAPVIDATKVNIVGGKYPVSNLTNFLRLKRLSYQGRDVRPKVVQRNIVVEQDGEYEVEYYTYPNITSVKDELDFLSNFSPDALISSTCAYWAVSHGQYQDFNRFHADYIDKASAIKDLRVFNIPKRRWE